MKLADLPIPAAAWFTLLLFALPVLAGCDEGYGKKVEDQVEDAAEDVKDVSEDAVDKAEDVVDEAEDAIDKQN